MAPRVPARYSARSGFFTNPNITDTGPWSNAVRNQLFSRDPGAPVRHPGDRTRSPHPNARTPAAAALRGCGAIDGNRRRPGR